jgi:hypothetical protein
VGKQIATAAVRGNKAKTLGIIEPFHDAVLNTPFSSSLKR